MVKYHLFFVSMNNRLFSYISLFISKDVENIFNLWSRKLFEFRLGCGSESDFTLISLEVTWCDNLEDLNSNFYSLLTGPIWRVSFLELFLQLTRSFLFLGTSWDSFETNSLPWRINSIALRSKLFITANNCNSAAECSHGSILWILLQILT